MNMKAVSRFLTSLLVIFCLFTAPFAVIASNAKSGASGDVPWKKKGEKNYKQGMQHEAAQQWDKAAEEFAFAVAADPKNAEYRLHYVRALFNASQMMMARGRTLADQKDYVGAYNAFRQAFGYDPVNELARAEMNRMLRLQQGTNDPDDPNKPKDSPTSQPNGVKLVPTAYKTNAAGQPQVDDPPQIEELRTIKYDKVDLKTVIKGLAQSLDLNVLFDTQTFRQGSPRDVTLDLQNVTTAQALDAIFLQENLFFQKVGRRMIVVADQNQRQRFQQLVLRTFYLSNAKPEEVQRILTAAIPPQQGRTGVTAIADKETNSLTIRDTSENLKIIGNLIKSLDKDRSEVVMDVNIYEVTKTALLQIGNQIGTEAGLTNLGGTSSGAVGLGANGDIVGRGANTVANAIATGFILPASNLVAFQSKDNTRLLASTQVHAFNNEESQARIGQRVPVQTAQVYNGSQQGGGTGVGAGSVLGNGYPVINYEQVGLTLKFTPIVFPNQDVQVKMSIESKDVSTGGLTPTFTERSISGTARIQNNRTLLLASVAQDSQSEGRAGLPLLGLIPILGRLFTAPRKGNRQVDIVIAVTPRVLRAPTILPEDEIEQPTGSIAVPTNSSLSDLIRQEDRDDQIAAARRVPNVAVVQLPDQKPEEAAPAYTAAASKTEGERGSQGVGEKTAGLVSPKLIDSSVKTLNLQQTSENLADKPEDKPAVTNQLSAELQVSPLGALKAGEKRRVAIMVNSLSAVKMAVLSLGYDPNKIKINRVLYGEIFGAELAQKDATAFAAANGNLMANLMTRQNQTAQGAGVLAYLEIEAIVDADDASLQIKTAATNLIGVGGENIVIK